MLPAHWQPTKTKRIHTAADNSTQLNLRLTRLLTAVQAVFATAEGAGRQEASVTRQELQAAVDAVGAGSQRQAGSRGPAHGGRRWAGAYYDQLGRF